MRVVRWLVSLSVLGAVLVCSGRSVSAQTCSISVTSVKFGVYDVFSTSNLASTGAVTYRCSGWTSSHPIVLLLGKGVYGSSYNSRQMASGNSRLNYYLCRDAGQNTASVWGDAYPDGYGFIYLQNTSGTAVTIYGWIPFGQDVSAGSYSDTVVATVLF